MPVLKTKPVMFCKRCGKPVIASFVAFRQVEGMQLDMARIMGMVQENALCETCENKRAWYFSNGRSREWEEGNT